MNINELWFSKDDDVFKNYKVIDNDSEDNHLNGLSRVNIFIGPNNSGKSRFLRNLFLNFNKVQNNREIQLKDHPIFFRLFDSKSFKSILKEFSDKVSNSIYHLDEKEKPIGLKIKSRLEIFNTEILISPEFSAWELSLLKNSFDELKNKIIGDFFLPLTEGKPSGVAHTTMRSVSEFEETTDAYLKKLSEELTKIEKGTVFDFKLQLIPANRSLNNYQNELEISERYVKRFFEGRNDLISGIYTGDDFFNQVQIQLLSGIDQIENVLNFSKFIGSTFYNKKFSISAPNPKGNENETNKQLKVKIGSDDELRLNNLGDGVQAVIGLIYPYFFNGSNGILSFIDEPEHNLHPGFQRIFLETLLQDRFKNTQTFICTHSNHFLDMSLDYPEDISILKFQKKGEGQNADFEIKKVAGGDKTVLQSIGARNSSVFLSNCTIWVEGITDRLYIRAWLAAYQKARKLDDQNFKEFREDIHYSFVEFGGANITHWSFLDDHDGINVEALCGDAFVIADKDKTDSKDKKSDRHMKLENVLKERYYKTPSREIENLLTPELLKLGINESVKQEAKFDEFKYEDYQNDGGIGSFLFSKMKEPRLKINADSGTLSGSYKVKICQAISQTIHEKVDDPKSTELDVKSLLIPDGFDENSKETAWHLAELIYNFIENKNT